jgi:capsular polysaccharide export protein
MTVAQMQKVLRKARIDLTEAPTHWGDIRQHAFYSFVYHLNILLNNRAFPRFQSHRTESVAQEFRTYLRRLLLHPIDIVKRQITTRRIKNSGQAYHLILMQLEHDSAFLMHSPFKSMPEFLQCVIEGFAAGAPRHHRLVFKAHPLESGRRALARDIAALAAR